MAETSQPSVRLGCSLRPETRPMHGQAASEFDLSRDRGQPLPRRSLARIQRGGTSPHSDDPREDESDARVAVFWHHGTPKVGSPRRPLFSAAADNGLRWVAYDRPAYGGSSPNPGRDIASAAADVAAIADALGIGRFAVLGHTGGGPHALACGALLPERVIAVVSGSAPAPFDAEGLDWFAGWSRSGVAEQRAALAGRAALEEYLPSAEFDPETFTPEDHAALEGRWSWLGELSARPWRRA